MGIFGVMYNLYIRELGLAGEVSGHVIAMTALATAIILVPAGLLSDRVGRKWMIIIGAGLTAHISCAQCDGDRANDANQCLFNRACVGTSTSGERAIFSGKLEAKRAHAVI